MTASKSGKPSPTTAHAGSQVRIDPMTSKPKQRSVHTQKQDSIPSSKDFVATSVKERKELTCLCGCGETFTPRDHRQKYIGGHRFNSPAYSKSHACPSCGIIHREGVTK